MVYTCFVCKWRANKEPRRSFHRFPANKDERKRWLDILGKKGASVSSRIIICSAHFEENCFRYGPIMGNKLLKKGSLPSLYLTTKPPADLPIKEPNRSGSCTTAAPTEICWVDEITPERTEEVIECRKPNQSFHLRNSNLKQLTEHSIETKQLQLQYMNKQLVEKKKIISALRRKVRRLCQSKSALKARLKHLERQNAELLAEKEVLNSRLSPISEVITFKSEVEDPTYANCMEQDDTCMFEAKDNVKQEPTEEESMVDDGLDTSKVLVDEITETLYTNIVKNE